MPFLPFPFHPYHAVSLLVIVLLTLGLIFKRHKTRHIQLMSAAFVIDMGLLLVIEVSRHAVEKVASLGLPLITWIHVAISIAVVVLYIVQIVLGRRLSRANQHMRVEQIDSLRQQHGRLGLFFYGLRLLNFATSLMLPL